MPVFDATTLLLFLEPDAGAPLEPITNEPVTNAKARIDHLIGTFEKRRQTTDQDILPCRIGWCRFDDKAFAVARSSPTRWILEPEFGEWGTLCSVGEHRRR